MRPLASEHKNDLLKKEHTEMYILSHKAAIHYHAVVAHNARIKCQNFN